MPTIEVVEVPDTVEVSIADPAVIEVFPPGSTEVEVTQGAAGVDQAILDAHADDTTDVHGIADTTALVVDSDLRLTNERVPVDGSVTQAKLNSALDAALARVTDPRFTDERVPVDGSVTNAKVAAGAGIVESKLALDVATGLLIPKSLLTGAGQLVGASGNGVPVAIPAPTTEGDVLTAQLAQAAKMAWVAPTGGGGETTSDRARVYSTVNIATANGTSLSLPFNTERVDSNGLHDNSTNNSRLTCKVAGSYLIVANLRWASNGSGIREVSLRLNNTTTIASVQDAGYSTGEATQSVATVYELAVNDYVEVSVWQNSGGALNVLAAGNFTPEFMMIRVPGGGASTTGEVVSTYTPTLTASTTNPTLGTGSSQVGRYTRVGRLAIVDFYILFGTSGAAAGSGNYLLNLPLTAYNNLGSSLVPRTVVGHGFINDDSTSVRKSVHFLLEDSPYNMVHILVDGATDFGTVTNTYPWTWTIRDGIRGTLMYLTDSIG